MKGAPRAWHVPPQSGAEAASLASQPQNQRVLNGRFTQCGSHRTPVSRVRLLEPATLEPSGGRPSGERPSRLPQGVVPARACVRDVGEPKSAGERGSLGTAWGRHTRMP